ncbi:hypothetical protein NQ314_004412 [Rhamnusium bicolor]|uniref:Uncharacterized protein n=1 Tax=Rhamnusium bicolor TaxID=1586634 RepID=A0AAV8ZLB1_9CUCU|nr:hypothetical protein NQ314_004412 [Rhamnusium bicolor]
MSANGILPVRELKIDDDTNAIDYILVEQSQLDLEGSIEGIKNEIEENSEENDRIEYIEIETLNDDIESLIMEASENDGEINKENNIVDQPRVKKSY